MATVNPEHLPTRATAGEKRIHEILRRLPSEWFVYWEPDIGGLYPDFVIIAPGRGVLIIEDKSWYPRTIRKGDSNEIVISTTGGVPKKVKHPARQVREYFHRFLDTLEKQRFGKRFVKPAGPFEGRLNFPVARIVTLSNISSAQLHDPERNLAAIFPSEKTVTRDQLDEWASLSEDELVSVIGKCFHPFKAIAPFTTDEINALRMTINPQIDLEAQFRTDDILSAPRPIDDQQDVLAVFDGRQEKYAMNVGEGHRILFGVAGSGKTLILLTRARLLAKQNPEAEILLTCYNRALSMWMARHLKDCPNVTVMNFHSWGRRNGVVFTKETAEHFGETFLEVLSEGRGDAGRFDAVLVDEAQDFEPGWFRCLLASMKDPENGDLLIVADGAQSLYSRSKISWKELGIKAQGRTHSQRFDLNRNYRNSTEILSLAETFATRTELQAGADSDDSIRAVRVDPTLGYRGTGASPLLLIRHSWEDEVEAVIGLVKRMLDGRWCDRTMAPLQPGEIAILYPRATSAQKRMLEELPGKLSEACQVSATRGTASSGDPANSVQIQTIHSSKGLQFRAVILLWAGIKPYQIDSDTGETTEITDRRLLYVGMTRAESFLAITSSGYSPYVVDMEESPACTVLHQKARAQRLKQAV
ncbi:MAG: AAA family ATPase [Verrucomicrobiales bacterium]|nr:AAA family ATPase [Verrucomicrobiales bacterium]